MIGIRSKTGIVLHLAAAVAFVMTATSSEPARMLVSLVIGIGLEISAWIAYVLHVEKERST
jgi:hypothetical protein